MQEVGEKTNGRQLSFEDEFARVAQETRAQRSTVRDAQELERIASIELPSAEDLTQQIRNPDNLRAVISGFGVRAVAQGKSPEEVSQWARQVSTQLGVNGNEQSESVR
jgi:hypothetical protein